MPDPNVILADAQHIDESANDTASTFAGMEYEDATCKLAEQA